MSSVEDGLRPVIRAVSRVGGQEIRAELLRERALLAEADLEDMKRTFVSSVSHALRTPLASILGITLTLAREDVRLSSEERRDMLDRLARNARRLDAHLSDVLELRRLAGAAETPRRHATDLADLLTRSVREIDLRGRAIEIESEPIIAFVDEGKVARILEELLMNADRHTPCSTRLWARLHRAAGGVLLVVEDDGPGIPDQFKQVVFEPLRLGEESSHAHAPGLGAGLALVAGYAELHGGHAWVQDRPGGGASFRVFLPAVR